MVAEHESGMSTQGSHERQWEKPLKSSAHDVLTPCKDALQRAAGQLRDATTSLTCLWNSWVRALADRALIFTQQRTALWSDKSRYVSVANLKCDEVYSGPWQRNIHKYLFVNQTCPWGYITLLLAVVWAPRHFRSHETVNFILCPEWTGAASRGCSLAEIYFEKGFTLIV